MKTTSLIFTLLFLMPVLIFAQTATEKKTDDTTNKVDASNRRTGYWEEKIGDQIMKGYYVNDKRTGTWILCVNTGLLQKLESYDNGLKNGISISLDRKGHLKNQEYYKNDKLSGLSVTYGMYSEMPLSQINYIDGVKNGVSKLYYDNGKIQEEAIYKAGVKEGPSKWYSSAGRLLALYNYHNGQFEGVQETFYENDSVQTATMYSNNIINGGYKEFYRNGIIKLSGSYINAIKEGAWIEYDETGKAVKTTKYKKGVAK